MIGLTVDSVRSLTNGLKQLVWALAPEQRCMSADIGVLRYPEESVQELNSLI